MPAPQSDHRLHRPVPVFSDAKSVSKRIKRKPGPEPYLRTRSRAIATARPSSGIHVDRYPYLRFKDAGWI